MLRNQSNARSLNSPALNVIDSLTVCHAANIALAANIKPSNRYSHHSGHVIRSLAGALVLCQDATTRNRPTQVVEWRSLKTT